MKILYTTAATATGGRDGQAKTEDGTFAVKLSVPKEMGGAGGDGANPEQLFASGYSACFLGAIKAVSAKSGPKIPDDASVKATVSFGKLDGTGYGLDVSLAVSLPGVPREEAEEAVRKAHEVCPYSNATRNNIDVKITVL